MPDLIDIAERLVVETRSGEQIEVCASRNRDTDIRCYEGEIEQLASAESAGIGIRVVTDGRQGFAYVGDLDEARAHEALDEARDNATFASYDEHVGLAEPDDVRPASLELWRDEVAKFTTAEKVQMTLDLERQVRARDPRIRQVMSTDYGDAQGEVALVSSTGIRAQSRETTCYLAVETVAGESDDTQTGSGYTVGRSPSDLLPDDACSDAVDRALRLLGAKKPKSAHLNVVLDRRVTSTLLSVLSQTLSGEEVAKGRSLFAGRLGEQVGVSALTLVDDPTDERAFGASSFDGEGLACRRNLLIEDGKLASFLYDTYSARLASTVSTASAVRAGFTSTPGVGARALSLLPGELDQDAIVRMVGTGLYVQGVSGVHSGVNPISGDFSVGAEGLMIRNGELAEPVREITIASTIQRILQSVLAIGSDVEWLPSVASGMSLAISDVAMSGD